jgi:hypothetical protein
VARQHATEAGPGEAVPTAGPTILPLGPGFADVVPRQLVRAADDRLYAFAGAAPSTAEVRAYWTTSPGLPTAPDAFGGTASLTADGSVVSVEAAYDGGTIVHVLVYANPAGTLKDYPFDTAAGAFRPGRIVASGLPTVGSDYIGSSGVSAMVDAGGRLHVAYWAAGDQIVHRAFAYAAATDALAEVGAPTRLDADGRANHPSLAVSPLDGSLTVAWVSEATSPASLSARTRAADGTWGPTELVSSAPVWTSTTGGINIDQGPSLVVGADGARHLSYIEDFDRTGDYGRVHYARNDGAGWVDQVVPLTYTHDPALALGAAGELYLLGHGHRNSAACLSELTICVKKRGQDGTWGPSEAVATPSGSDSFDASVSTRWSAVGFNRPETVEFLFFAARNGSYLDTRLYYGRL